MTIKNRIGQYLIPLMPFSRFGLDVLRNELNGAVRRLQWKILPYLWLQKSRLRRQESVYANLASGGFTLPGFVNLDLFGGSPEVIRWDCATGVPFGDNKVLGIRIEHFLEHVEPREHLPQLLQDCHRALKLGGVLRIIVPDAEKFLRAYCKDDNSSFCPIGFPEPFPDDLPTRMDLVNHVFHQWHEHRWGYDFETLKHRLMDAGFSEVRRMTYRQSLDPRLAEDREVHECYSLYVDATK